MGHETCKAFCGMTAGQIPGDAVADADYLLAAFCSDLWSEGRRYCSAACVPTPAAQPSEAECGYPIGGDEVPCNLNKDHLGRHSLNRVVVTAQPAEQPKPAKFWWPNQGTAGGGPWVDADQIRPATEVHDFSDPYCARRYKGAVVRLCVACGAFDKDGMRSPKCDPVDGWRTGYEGWVGEVAQPGKPYAGPERLPRPRRAHVAAMHDDDLIGGGR